MSEIPRDIMEAAIKAYDEAMSYGSQPMAEHEIARAILAERERGLKQVIADIDHAKENWAGSVLMKLRRQYAVALDRLKGGAA